MFQYDLEHEDQTLVDREWKGIEMVGRGLKLTGPWESCEERINLRE